MNTIFIVIEKYKWYIVAWFLLNVFQATFTNLHYDVVIIIGYIQKF